MASDCATPMSSAACNEINCCPGSLKRLSGQVLFGASSGGQQMDIRGVSLLLSRAFIDLRDDIK